MESEEIARIFRDPTRRRILRLLGEEGPLEYSEILRRLGLKSTGRLNYHLKLLAPYLEKDDHGRYRLNSEGESLYRLLLGLGMASTYSLWRVVAVLMLSAAAVLGVFSWVLARSAVGGEYSSWDLSNAAFSAALVLVCLATAFYMEEPSSKADPGISGLVRINLFPFLLLLALIMLAESQPAPKHYLAVKAYLVLPAVLSWALTLREAGSNPLVVVKSSLVLIALAAAILVPSLAVLSFYGAGPHRVVEGLVDSVRVALKRLVPYYLAVPLALTVFKHFLRSASR